MATASGYDIRRKDISDGICDMRVTLSSNFCADTFFYYLLGDPNLPDPVEQSKFGPCQHKKASSFFSFLHSYYFLLYIDHSRTTSSWN